jgi:hypothetical protein
MARYLTNLAGLTFRPAEAKDCVKLLRPGFQLDLEREPDNAYDQNAIKIFANVRYSTSEPVAEPDESTDRLFIGYVEKIANSMLAAAMDSGQTWTAFVDKTYDDYEQPIKSGRWAKPLIEIITS